MAGDKIVLSLWREAAELFPPDWRLDEFAEIRGEIRYYNLIENISGRELEEILTAISSRGIIAEVERQSPRIYINILFRTKKKRESPLWLHPLLFFFTFITMSLTGAEFQGKWIIEDPSGIVHGFLYALALIIILSIHESGHYYHALRYKLPVTLPYFIPFYIPFMFQLGTFGAFIKMQGQMINRKALMDIGVSGPIWGFAASLAALTLGFAFFPDYQGMVKQISAVHPFPMPEGEGINIIMGKNLIFGLFQHFFHAEYLPMNEIYHFPLIFAGWIGTFVTALNLLPVGQLDGGHLMYALIGKNARYVGMGFVSALAVLSFFTSGWLLWVLLLIFLIRVKHPPVMDEGEELDIKRRYLGYLGIAVFLLCFIPAPVTVS